MQRVIIWILFLGVVVGIIFAVLQTSQRTIETPTPREDAVREEEQRPEKTITFKHQYKDGVHTFVGTIDTPTPCYDVSAAIVTADLPEIRIETQPTSDDVCVQVITDHEFTVTHTGSADMSFIATLNGEPVNINQFEVDPEQDINEVDLFIKG